MTDGVSVYIHAGERPGVHIHSPYGVTKFLQVAHRHFNTTPISDWHRIGHAIYRIIVDLSGWCTDDYDQHAEGIQVEGAQSTRSNQWRIDIDLDPDVFMMTVLRRKRPLRQRDDDQTWGFPLHLVASGDIEVLQDCDK